VAVVAAILVVLGLLELVLKLAAEHRACESTEDAVAAHLVTAKVSGCTATEGAHQTAVAFLLHGWIAAAILLAGLSVSVLALRVLILTVGSLLGELVLRLCAGVASLLVLALLLVVVLLAALLLTMLEAALCGRAVLRVVVLLLSVTLLTILLLWLVLLVPLLLVATLVVSTLLVLRLAVSLLRVLLLLAVALVVLVVARHLIEVCGS